MNVVLVMVLEIVFISMVIVGLYRLQSRLGLAAGADAFLRKPIVLDDLFACLGEVMGVRFQYAAVQVMDTH